MDYDALLEISTEIGYRLMESGAEIYRVEESIRRILEAYHPKSAEVFAIPNCIISSLVTPDGKPLTRMRRVPNHGTNVEQLESYNALCRSICEERPELPELKRQVEAYAETAARVRKCPVTGYLLVALFPLVPGGGIYYTMEYCIQGETQRFLESLLHTFGVAGALAVGAVLVSSTVRLLTSFLRSRREKRNRGGCV